MIPEIYCLRETTERDYAIRTERNVIEADGTLILYRKRLSGGTELTRKLATKHRRRLECIDLSDFGEADFERVRLWIDKYGIKVLNVAGPRESTCAGIGKQAERFLVDVLKSETGR